MLFLKWHTINWVLKSVSLEAKNSKQNMSTKKAGAFDYARGAGNPNSIQSSSRLDLGPISRFAKAVADLKILVAGTFAV